ncbi:diacylglycerol kinase [Gloeothece citriformis PCC 7424]|uniref:Diacylglycerol kinase n=1 Tax=Gloeothece citriformis (strain PCC 7424) TaxID=65393 RepID=B7K7S8_GLOC7|nr:diacylglycerol kinase family protein [Gloeothece citriformis]ACK71124.1 diacylglycerol kinase [Gloeothece citriformis PCC 7424]
MKSNLRISQSANGHASIIPYLPSNGLGANPFIEEANHLRRDYAWQVASNLFVSFKYAWAGVCYAFTTQRNFRIHVTIGVLAISLSVFLRVTPVEMAVIAVTCALVMVLELLNTALESVVDLTVGQSYHELAKIAKDCAAGAVLIAAMAALLVASFILIPPFMGLVSCAG